MANCRWCMSLVPPLLRVSVSGRTQCASHSLITAQKHSKQLSTRIATGASLSIETSDIYISTSTSPVWNLSLEDLLFRKASANRPLLLLYRNEPCVVIGRNQNPWKEINQTALRQANVPFIRRRSGGGTVYHDMGNTNFSLHLPRTSFERRKGSELAVEALKKLKVPDVWVSGSAYKIINARAYHHGTMLLDARIDLLGDILRNTKETMVGRSVASVRSPVRNIVEFKPDVTHESFSKALCAAFCEKFGAEIKVVEIGEEIMEKNAFAAERDFIEKSATELESWEWKYGQTLEFTHVIESTANERQLYANIVAKHGIITSCRLTMDGKEDGLQSLCADLVGKRYGMLQDSEFNIGTPELDVLHWLQHEM